MTADLVPDRTAAHPAWDDKRRPTLLAVQDLSVHFGGLTAVDRVTLEVPTGAVVGMIGPNGAGKTTFIDALMGYVASSGSLLFDGRRIDDVPAFRRARLGLSRTFQQMELFDDLTVRENLQVAAERVRWWAFLADLVMPGRTTNEEQVEWAIDILGLHDEAPLYPSQLSHGSRQAVSIGRALAARPKLLILDEPGAGLEAGHKQILSEILRDLAAEEGMTIFLVDHDMELVMPTCEYLFVLEFGRLIAQGTPTQVRRDQRVVEAYLGHQQRGDGGGEPQ